MFEGKHIHSSEVDKKLLCSYSAKLCKQRRINGYGFCIRHVLEDKSAPFRQCNFVAKYNHQQCTNAIPVAEDREYCSSHMQVLGLAPKRIKKRKNEDEVNSPSDLSEIGISSISELSRVSKSKHKKKKKKKRKKEKHKNKKDSVNQKKDSSLLPPVESLLDVIPLNLPNGSNTLPAELLKTLDNKKANSIPSTDKSVIKPVKSKRKNTRTSSKREESQKKKEKRAEKQTSTLTKDTESDLQQRLLEFSKHFPSTSDHFPELTSLRTSNQLSSDDLIAKVKQKQSRILFTDKIKTAAVDRLRDHLQRDEDLELDLFPCGLEYSDHEDSEIEEDPLWKHRLSWTSSSTQSLLNSRRKVGAARRQDQIQKNVSSLKQKCQRLSDIQRLDRFGLKRRKETCKSIIQAARAHPFGTTVSLLRCQDRPLERPTLPTRHERICCSKENGEDCTEEVVPFARHCYRHILEDENQMLFYQCAAEFPGGLRCIEPCFDVINEDPLCIEHAKTMRTEPKLKKPRKKTKPSALTRPFKKRRRNQHKKNMRPQKPIPPAEPLNFNSLPSFNTSTPVPERSPSPSRLDTSNEMADSEMNAMLDRHLGLSFEEADLHLGTDEEGANIPSDAEEEDLSKILPKLPVDLNDIFGGKNGDGDLYSTNNDVDVLAKLLEATEHIKAEEFTKSASDELLIDDRTSLPVDTNDTDIGDDSADGLPSDLQSAANKLIEDTMREQASQNGHVVIPPQTVPSSDGSDVSLHQTIPNQAILNALNGTNCSPGSFSPGVMNHTQHMPGQDGDNSQTLNQAGFMQNGLYSLNAPNTASAMLHMAAVSQQLGLSQGMPATSAQRVAPPSMSPHNAHLMSNLPQHSPQTLIAPGANSPLQATTQNTLPSFRQIWNTGPLPTNLLNRQQVPNGLISHSNSLDVQNSLHPFPQLASANSFIHRTPFHPLTDPAQLLKATTAFNSTSQSPTAVSTTPSQLSPLQALLGIPRYSSPHASPLQNTPPVISLNNGSNIQNVPPPKT